MSGHGSPTAPRDPDGAGRVRGAVAKRPSVLFTAVVVVLAAGIGLVTWLRPPAVAIQAPARTTALVSTTRLVCPDVSALGSDSQTTVTAGAAPASVLGPPLADVLASGQATLRPLGSLDAPGTPSAPSDAVLSERGPTTIVDVRDADAGPLVVDGTAGLAPGLAAIQVTQTDTGESRGLAATACGAPATDFWFLGLATEIGHGSRLVLANTEQASADIHLDVFGPDGPVAIPSADVVVSAGGSATYDIDGLAPDETALAVHVAARVGRVSAGVLDRRVVGIEARGTDWVAASGPAATRLVVPGIPGGSGERLLQVLAPGDLDTTVRVRLLTATGPISPVGLESIELTAGEVSSVSLADVTGGEPVAVELTSEQPIVAGARATFDGAIEDTAFVAAGAPLPAPVLVPNARTGTGWQSALLLTSTGAAATVTLTFLSAGGDVVGTRVVSLPADATTQVELAPPDVSGSFQVVIAPDRPDGVLAVLQLRLDTATVKGTSLVPLVGEPLAVSVPRVRQDLSTGLPPGRP